MKHLLNVLVVITICFLAVPIQSKDKVTPQQFEELKTRVKKTEDKQEALENSTNGIKKELDEKIETAKGHADRAEKATKSVNKAIKALGQAEESQAKPCVQNKPGEVLICIDATKASPSIMRTFPSNLIISPNQKVRVWVKYRSTSKPAIASTTTDTSGVYNPSVQPFSSNLQRAALASKWLNAIRDKIAKKDTSNETKIPVTQYWQTLVGPFLPGRTTLKLSFTDRSDPTSIETLSVSLEVEKTYSSAIRVGVGLLFGDVVDATFVGRKVNGSKQDEIVNTESSDMDLELVIGYAFFLDENGRGYTKSCYPWCFAPYAGLGLLSAERNELKWFNALYGGIEWSPIPESSIALAGVVRRVDRLYQGKVGQPVSDDPVVVSTYNFGLALVVNFSPEFIQFAKDYGQSQPSNQ